MRTYREAVEKAKAEYLERAISGRTIKEAAELAGCNRTHFHELLSKYVAREPRRRINSGNWQGL